MEKKITGNEPAFSKSAFYHPDGGVDSPNTGLTIRQHFAAMAMAAILQSNPPYLWGNIDRPSPVSVAGEALIYADALIASLNK